MQEESQSWASDQNRHSGMENSTPIKQLHKYLFSGCHKPGAELNGSLPGGRDRHGPSLPSHSSWSGEEPARRRLLLCALLRALVGAKESYGRMGAGQARMKDSSHCVHRGRLTALICHPPSLNDSMRSSLFLTHVAI